MVFTSRVWGHYVLGQIGYERINNDALLPFQQMLLPPPRNIPTQLCIEIYKANVYNTPADCDQLLNASDCFDLHVYNWCESSRNSNILSSIMVLFYHCGNAAADGRAGVLHVGAAAGFACERISASSVFTSFCINALQYLWAHDGHMHA